MAFPDDKDREIIKQADVTENLATDLCDWLADFNAERRATDLLPIPEADEFEMLRLRRMANSLYNSAKVPVAAAVYGPSQVGKSLFMGEVLKPSSEDYSPIGADEKLGPPCYYKELSFHNDLNPQSGSNEATALVTRFTTKDRMGADVSPEYPVMVRALTRVEWMRVLARGFFVECKAPEGTWQQSDLEELFSSLFATNPAKEVDRKWRMDILDTFSYMRNVDRRGFPAKESIVNGLLSRYPLTEEGYVAAASRLFWDSWPDLTALFNRIRLFLDKITIGDNDPALFCQWAAVRFLLDSQRAKKHERRTSQVWSVVNWSDIYLVQKDKYFVLEHRPDTGNGNEDLEVMQGGMLEMAIPVLPHRLSDAWRRVVEQMDFLDIPGMRAGRQGAEQGKRSTAGTIEEQMEIVKRGKVAYLFERYVDELQIQTLLLLSRGGNLEVTSQMKHHIDKWGRARYGETKWPNKVDEALPALFIGMTGIDEEFRNRAEYADKMLYNNRLSQIVDTLGPVMNDFGAPGKAFQNCYPLRYPGTWDADQADRDENDPERWVRAKTAFMAAELVTQYVQDPELRWDTCMEDGDGGLSLICEGARSCTSSEEKQNQLEKQIEEIKTRLLQISKAWVVDPDANVDREKRLIAAKKMVEWITSDERLIYHRVHALQEALCVEEGEEMALADCADTQSRRHGDPLPTQVKEFLHDWATNSSTKRWEAYVSKHKVGEPWLDSEDFASFTRYIRDYLTSEHCKDDLLGQLNPIVNLKTRDEAARRRARRKYVRMVMNDFIMSPGPSLAKLEPKKDIEVDDEAAEELGPAFQIKQEEEQAAAEHDYEEFGLMSTFVKRWVNRVPEALALGAGEHVQLPPGNPEIINILKPH